MRKVSVFNQISIDGFFKTPNGDIRWLHQAGHDDEFMQFTSDNASGEYTLVFGRTTYETMAGFWPTPAAAEQFPEVARDMNRRPKIVFSKTLEKTSWSNTTIVKDDPATAIKAMKSGPGDAMVIMGSGSIVSQLTRAGLIDEYQILVLPVVLGEGKTMFDGAKKQLNLTLKKSRTFKNGRAFLVYEPKA
jgi:dihydrofolate reductase